LEGWEKNYDIIARSTEDREELEAEGFLMWDLDDIASKAQS